MHRRMFKKLPGKAKQVSIGSPLEIWGIGNGGDIYRLRKNRSWKIISDKNLKFRSISVGYYGTLWGVTNDGGIHVHKYVEQPSGGTSIWSPIPGKLLCISIGSEKHIWGVNKQGIYRREGNLWKRMPGQAKMVTVNFKGLVYAVTRNNCVYRFIHEQTKWVQVPGSLEFANVGADGILRGIFKDQYFEYQTSSGGGGGKWLNITSRFPNVKIKSFEFVNSKIAVVTCKNGDVLYSGFGVQESGDELAKSRGDVTGNLSQFQQQQQPGNFVQIPNAPTAQNLRIELPPDQNAFKFEPINNRTQDFQIPKVVIDQKTFDEFIRDLKTQQFSSEKQEKIKVFSKRYNFTCSHLKQVLRCLQYSADKMFAIEMFAPSIIDKQNRAVVENTLTYQSEKMFLEKYFSATVNPQSHVFKSPDSNVAIDKTILKNLENENSRKDATIHNLQTQVQLYKKMIDDLGKKNAYLVADNEILRKQKLKVESEKVEPNDDVIPVDLSKYTNLESLKNLQKQVRTKRDEFNKIEDKITSKIIEMMELEKEKEKEQGEELRFCAVCQENPKQTVLNCGHTLCKTCSDQVTICPFCRVKIESRKRVFF